MSEVGIKAKTISGGPKTRGEDSKYGSHAWNQVCLDGVYYNCDLTNDADFLLECLKPPYFLKSTEEFGDGEKNRFFRFAPKNPDIVEKTGESISDKIQEELINEQRTLLKSQRSKLTNSFQEKKSFITKLKEFLGKSKSKGDDER